MCNNCVEYNGKDDVLSKSSVRMKKAAASMASSASVRFEKRERQIEEAEKENEKKRELGDEDVVMGLPLAGDASYRHAGVAAAPLLPSPKGNAIPMFHQKHHQQQHHHRQQQQQQ